MNVIINGKPREVSNDITVTALLKLLEVPDSIVMVEQNGEPVDRGDYPTRAICPGDTLEVVRFMGGG